MASLKPSHKYSETLANALQLLPRGKPIQHLISRFASKRVLPSWCNLPQRVQNKGSFSNPGVRKSKSGAPIRRNLIVGE